MTSRSNLNCRCVCVWTQTTFQCRSYCFFQRICLSTWVYINSCHKSMKEVHLTSTLNNGTIFLHTFRNKVLYITLRILGCRWISILIYGCLRKFLKLFRVTCFGVWSYVNYSALYFTSISWLHTHIKCDAELHERGCILLLYCLESSEKLLLNK